MIITGCSIPIKNDPYTITIPAPNELHVSDPFFINLTYIETDQPGSMGLPLFGGYQTWKQREESFQIHPKMKVT